MAASHIANEKNCKKVAKQFRCDNCDYNTSRKSSYSKHLLTASHIANEKSTNVAERVANEGHNCVCGKTYKYSSGLCKHKQVCLVTTITPEQDSSPTITNIDTAMFMELIQQNKELQNLLIQESKEKSELINKLIEREPGHNSVNTNCNNTINNNQKFNLNFFLNETCKDAMNIQEFMENLRITFQDLLTIGNDGFVNGVSDIFIKELRDLDVTKRPIHCTDSKRDTIYLKENGEWSRDTNEKTRLKNIIEKVEYKNVAALHQWCNENPDAKINNTDSNLLRDKIYLQTLQGDDKTREKIIKNIAREVVVEKEP
jgi:hypothetical protein